MKRILINATHSEEIRVALCKDNHLYDFDLENRTREQKKANIYKGHITRVEPSLEAAFVEYGSARQGFLPLREIASEYLRGNAREDGIKQLIKEGDEVIVQVEKEERGNKGAALSTYISLAGRYLVLMPNNAKAGGISRQISGKVREEMKQIIAGLNLPKGMSVIVRTAGLGKGAEDLQNDLDHLLDIWHSIQEQNKKRPSPCLVHQEAGVVTRAVRDYLRDDIAEVWIDSENAYNEAANFISAVMPAQMNKLRKYTEYEPMFARFGIERQIETAYQREVRLPSGGSIVIDQTEALVSIDINSSKSTKGSDVAETAYHTNLEAADEIARQLRLRDMGGLIVIDFIDMSDPRHQKDVEKRLIEATKYDRARVQFAEISKFGLMEMSRQRLRPSLEEATGYLCPRCHGNGLIRDLRSLSLSIMRQIEQIALKERMGEIQAEVPTDIAAFLLNEKRESLVYLEQDSGARITILPHAHLESPNFSLHFNPDGFAPSSYERIADTEEKETIDRGYEVNWQNDHEKDNSSQWYKSNKTTEKLKDTPKASKPEKNQPQAVAWLSNLFAPKPQAKLAGSLGSQDAAAAIEALVNDGNISLGAAGSVHTPAQNPKHHETVSTANKEEDHKPSKPKKPKKEVIGEENTAEKTEKKPRRDNHKEKEYQKREVGSRRESRGEVARGETLVKAEKADKEKKERLEKTKPEAKEIKSEKVGRKSSGDEVVLRVSSVADIETKPQAIHISLDNSKPKTAKAEKPKLQDDAATDIDTQKSVATSKDQSEKPTAEVTKITSVKDESVPQTSAPADVEADPQVAQELTVGQDLAFESPTTGQENQESPVKQKTLKNPTSTQLTAKLTQLAASLNKAPNDPRVVQLALSEAQKITGTAGQFIEQVLLAERSGQFVADFIKAVEQHRQTATSFDFSNFGYAPLDAAYTEKFTQQTQATSKTSLPQGKTQVSPQPIGRRAANDPRGQHPSFVDQLVDADLVVVQNHAESTQKAEEAEQVFDQTTFDQTQSDGDQAAVEKQANTEPNTDLLDLSTDQTDKSDQEPLEAKPEQATVSDLTLSQVEADQAQTAKTEQVAAEAVDTMDADATASSQEQMPVEETTEKAKTGGQVKQMRANQRPEKKSKANSYKDMIENVAGQLQPQQIGILNLMTAKTPKTPKARTRKTSKKDNKPKVIVKKISKSSETILEPKDE